MGADLALVHRAVAAERRVLLVQRDHAAAEALVLQRLAQHARRETTGLPSSVKPSGALVAQRGHLGQLVAGQPARDRRARSRRGSGRRARRRRAASAAAARSRRRVGVGHRQDGAEAAGGRGAGAGLEVLLVLLAGRAEVDVRVDEGREQVRGPGRRRSRRPSGASSAAGRADLGDLAVADEDVARLVEPGARVEDAGLADQDVGVLGGRLDEQRLGHRGGRLLRACGLSVRDVPARTS